MKIIIIPNTPYMGGRHYCIAKMLALQGHEIHYFISKPPYNVSHHELVKSIFTSVQGDQYEYEEFVVHKVRRLPLFWPVINGWLFKAQLKRLYKKIGADVVFTQSYTNETEVPKSIPYVYDLADDYAAPADIYGSPLYKLAFKLLNVRGVMKRQCHNALAVTAVSNILCNYAEQYSNNVVKLPNGVERSFIREALKIKPDNTKNNHSLVYSAYFDRWNRVIETLQAIVKLRQELPDLKLTLIGKGPESENIKKFIEDHQAEDYIHQLGIIRDRKKLFSLISQSSIGLNISDKNKWRDASHPMKVMDYSALGLKVVSTDLSEVRALNLPNIFLFSDYDKKRDLVATLRHALEDKKKYQQISKKVLRDYSWEDLTKKLASLFIQNNTQAAARIVHISSSYPPKLGGLEMVVQALAGTQSRMGHNVTVITSNQGATEDELFRDDFTVFRLKSFVFANTIIMPTLFFKLLRLKRDDTAHIHIVQAYTPEVVWLASKIKDFRYVAHIHLDVPPKGPMGIILESYKSLSLRRVLHGASSVIVPTSDYKTLAIKKYGLPAEKVFVVPNATDHKVSSIPKSAPGKNLNLLFVGRLSFQKDISFLLQALAQYAEKYGRNFHFRIAGDGELKQQLQEESSKLNLNDVVEFVGPLSYSVLEDAYKKADLFLLSSIRESFGLVLVEAMAKGVPIVSTNIPAVRDVVRNHKNGLLTRHDKTEFTEAIRTLATDAKKYETISANNIQNAKKYDWDKVCKKLDEIYAITTRGFKSTRKTPRDRKSAIIICHNDAYANAVKPKVLQQYLERKDFTVELLPTGSLTRLGDKGLAQKLPGLTIYAVWGYTAEAIHLATAHLPNRIGRRLRSAILLPLLKSHARLIHLYLKKSRPDLVICETNMDAGFVQLPRIANVQILDLPSPMAEEYFYGLAITYRCFQKIRMYEAASYSKADALSFHWHTYTDYVKETKYDGHNFINLSYGTNEKHKRAHFLKSPKVIFLGYLQGYWVNLPLLESLCAAYPEIDVYGGPKPPEDSKINYKGYAPSLDVMADYQFGLTTISDDPLRQSSFSSKHLEYISYGLPVLTPDWRHDSLLDASSIYYKDAEDFLQQLEKYRDKKAWQRKSNLALATARRLNWEHALDPLRTIIEHQKG